MRTELLRANGGNPGLILFHEDDTVQQVVKDFGEQIEELEAEYRRGLDTLLDNSRDLIQLEFNLASIVEAQKSRITNLSMKRLSWITVRVGS
ncbi:hypothetical protein VTH82DRAFT_4031 [Thermothelomyces myriococcoides]